MSHQGPQCNPLLLWQLHGKAQQQLSFEDSRAIDCYLRENPAKPLQLRSLLLNLKNKTAVDTASNSSFYLVQVDGAWSVFWNVEWRQFPQDLCGRLSASLHRNPAAVVETTDLFHQPGRYLFNLINMTVTDVTRNNTSLPLKFAAKEPLDDFTPDFSMLANEGAKIVRIAATEVRASFSDLAAQGATIPERFATLPGDHVVCERVCVTRPQTTPRMLLGNSYSNGLYGWVWDKLMKRGAVPAAAAPGVQLKNISFVNNLSMMQRFRAAVEKLDVPNDWPASPDATELQSLCSSFLFLSKYKTRIALMMHATDEFTSRIIVSCGFSMELNGGENGFGKGIVFTSDRDFALAAVRQRLSAASQKGSGCLVLSWVAIGQPDFSPSIAAQQGGCTTHFLVTRNGVGAVNGAKPDTPVLIAFEPELCCPFAVAELDLLMPKDGTSS